MSWQLDHLAVAAATLDEGVEWLADRLGARPGRGGRHPAMGTHNRLMSLGPGLYLEVIAIDPDAPAPGRARWFDLDRFTGPPRLSNWIVRVPDLDAALATAPEGSGTPLQLERGDYRWRMAVPQDGILPFDNSAPALIEWQGGVHPADALPTSPVRLIGLEVSHPAPLSEHLPQVKGVRYAVGAPRLRAVLDTPLGERTLG